MAPLLLSSSLRDAYGDFRGFASYAPLHSPQKGSFRLEQTVMSPHTASYAPLTARGTTPTLNSTPKEELSWLFLFSFSASGNSGLTSKAQVCRPQQTAAIPAPSPAGATHFISFHVPTFSRAHGVKFWSCGEQIKTPGKKKVIQGFTDLG